MFPPLLLPFPCSHPSHKIQLRIEKSTELSGFSHWRHMCEEVALVTSDSMQRHGL